MGFNSGFKGLTLYRHKLQWTDHGAASGFDCSPTEVNVISAVGYSVRTVIVFRKSSRGCIVDPGTGLFRAPCWLSSCVVEEVDHLSWRHRWARLHISDVEIRKRLFLGDCFHLTP